jgi:hypothetical protein
MSKLADIAAPLRPFKPRRLFASSTACEYEHLASQAGRSDRSGHFAISNGGSRLRSRADRRATRALSGWSRARAARRAATPAGNRRKGAAVQSSLSASALRSRADRRATRALSGWSRARAARRAATPAGNGHKSAAVQLSLSAGALSRRGCWPVGEAPCWSGRRALSAGFGVDRHQRRPAPLVGGAASVCR